MRIVKVFDLPYMYVIESRTAYTARVVSGL